MTNNYYSCRGFIELASDGVSGRAIYSQSRDITKRRSAGFCLGFHVIRASTHTMTCAGRPHRWNVTSNHVALSVASAEPRPAPSSAISTDIHHLNAVGRRRAHKFQPPVAKYRLTRFSHSERERACDWLYAVDTERQFSSVRSHATDRRRPRRHLVPACPGRGPCPARHGCTAALARV